MRPEAYKRIKELADNKDVSIGNAIDELVMAGVNDDGVIIANQLKAKTDWGDEE
jgi:hypothetical protein